MTKHQNIQYLSYRDIFTFVPHLFSLYISNVSHQLSQVKTLSIAKLAASRFTIKKIIQQ